jgi:hypothetical protein
MPIVEIQELLEGDEWYPARVESIEEKESTIADAPDPTYWAVRLTVTTPDGEPRTVTFTCPPRIKNTLKTGRFVAAAFGVAKLHELAGQVIERQDLPGRELDVLLGVKARTDGEEFNSVDRFRPRRTAPAVRGYEETFGEVDGSAVSVPF